MIVPFTKEPLVTVVIPTHKRPAALLRAVRSALSQTHREIEVLVVIDGQNVETLNVLSFIDDFRVRIIQLDSNRGPGEARNAGVAEANGEWVAFLDDDDEWFPEKLERQLALAEQAQASQNYEEPIISCRFVACLPSGECVWPVRFPIRSEPISEYLLVRNGLMQGDGIIATPTILTKRSLLRRVPFPAALEKHEDWEWLLKATSQPSVCILFCPETLAICHMRQTDSASRKADWKFSLNWIHSHRALVTSRAYSSFIATHVGWQAAAQGSWSVFGSLLWDAFQNGSLRPIDVARYVGFWLVPPAYRSAIKRHSGYSTSQVVGRRKKLAFQAGTRT
jgi:glycosyltransferase involved in cell wall biosynthesis